MDFEDRNLVGRIVFIPPCDGIPYNVCRKIFYLFFERSYIVKKFMLIAAATALLGAGQAFAQVIVRVAPPAPIVEERGPARPGFVWVEGYHRWDGHRYVWTHGRWVHPPRGHAEWIPGHWDSRPGGYVWIQGHWR